MFKKVGIIPPEKNMVNNIINKTGFLKYKSLEARKKPVKIVREIFIDNPTTIIRRIFL
jgi:hypothetical protein